jgi:hypothetical protein
MEVGPPTFQALPVMFPPRKLRYSLRAALDRELRLNAPDARGSGTAGAAAAQEPVGELGATMPLHA